MNRNDRFDEFMKKNRPRPAELSPEAQRDQIWRRIRQGQRPMVRPTILRVALAMAAALVFVVGILTVDLGKKAELTPEMAENIEASMTLSFLDENGEGDAVEDLIALADLE